LTGGSDAYGQGFDAEEGEEACGWGLEGCVGALCPGEEAPGVTIEGDRTRAHGNDSIRRGEAALEAVLGEEDGYSPLLIQATKQPDQLVAGYGVELGGWLVEEDEAWASDEGCREGHTLELAAGEGVDGSIEQVGDGEGQGDLLDRSSAGSRWVAAHLQRELYLRGNCRGDDLGLGILGDVADHGGQLPRSSGDRVGTHHLDPALDLAAVEVRDEAAGGTKEGRLARGGAAGEEGELAWG